MIDRWHPALGGIAGYAPAVARFDSADRCKPSGSLLTWQLWGRRVVSPAFTAKAPSAFPRQAAAGFESRHGDQRRPNGNSPTRNRRCDIRVEKKTRGRGGSWASPRRRRR